MFRRPFRVINVKPLLRPTRSCNPYENRLSSTGPRGGGRKFLVSLVGATTLGIGGTIAYASYDSDFRKQLNQTIPFSEDILTPLIGAPDSSSSVPTKSPLPEKPVNRSDESLMKKRLDRSKIKLDQEASKAISSNPSSSSLSPQTASVPPPPLDIPESEKKSVKVEKTVKHEDKKEVKTSEPTKIEKPVAVVVPSSVKNESTDKKSSVTIASKLEDQKAVKSNVSPMKDTSSDISDEFTSTLAQQYSKIEDLEADFEQKIDMIRDEYERELMKQLKRQVAVYLDHLNDQLEVQRNEMERIQRLAEEDKILAIKDRFYSELSGALNKLNEIENVLAVRKKLEEEEIGARKLWLLCQSLKDSLKCNGLKEPTPVKEEINSMKQTVEALSIKSPMSTSILNSIPNNVIEEGVHNEDSLIERFHKVDKLCKRVALIGDDGGSLYHYFLSYLQSLLLIDSVKIPEQELTGTVQIDPTQWDTFEILARVKYCLGQRNIEQALRYANQLKGAPRKVAKDWIIDTRTHLEVRQATELLQALAATITIRAVK